jgi:hypothetical protein
MHHDVPLGCVQTHLQYSQAIAMELQYSHDTRAVIIDYVSCVTQLVYALLLCTSLL